jgi:hypothetical protein
VLNGSRQVGWSVGPIPLSEIKAYVDLFGIDDHEMFTRCVRHMDGIWLQKHRQAEQTAADGKPDVRG